MSNSGRKRKCRYDYTNKFLKITFPHDSISSNTGQTKKYFLAFRYTDKPNIIWILGGDVRGSEKNPANGVYSYLEPVACCSETVFHPVTKYADGTDWVLLLRF